jgi:hypothetical protein
MICMSAGAAAAYANGFAYEAREVGADATSTDIAELLRYHAGFILIWTRLLTAARTAADSPGRVDADGDA